MVKIIRVSTYRNAVPLEVSRRTAQRLLRRSYRRRRVVVPPGAVAPAVAPAPAPVIPAGPPFGYVWY